MSDTLNPPPNQQTINVVNSGQPLTLERRPLTAYRRSTNTRAKVDKQTIQEQRLCRHLETAIANSETIDALLVHLSQIAIDQSDCLALWAAQTDKEGNFGTPHSLCESEGQVLWDVIADQAKPVMDRVTQSKQICSTTLNFETSTELVMAPVPGESLDSPVRFLIIGCFSNENQSVLRHQWLCGMLSQSVANWFHQRMIKHHESKSRCLNDTIGLVYSLDQTTSVDEAAMVVANYLRKLTASEQVAVSFTNRPGTPGKLQAVSDVEMINLEFETNKTINMACDQAILLGEVQTYPSQNEERTPADLALEKYCKSNGVESCIVVPLASNGSPITGSILIGGDLSDLSDPSFRSYAEQIVGMIAGHIDVIKRANQGIRESLKAKLLDWKRSKTSKYVLYGLVACAMLMCVPLPYRVACDCEVQPVMRRFIASPYDGILEKSFAESGDIVEQDETLAHLDGRTLRIEISGLRAEFDGAKKRRDLALAQGDIAGSQIAKSEMIRHQSNIEILEQQLSNLDVKSPIAGIVVKGDLEKVEGAPLEMGQTMFEIAPLNEMVAEIGIPESEIQYIKPGQMVKIKLTAFPFQTWDGEVVTIYPRTEIKEDESVFIAQVKLPNPDNKLRPGMKGSAKISSGLAPIGWNYFHRPWESIRYWMIW